MYAVKYLKDSGAHKAGDVGELEKAVYKQLLAEAVVKEIDPNAKPEIVDYSSAPVYVPDSVVTFPEVTPEDLPTPKKPAKKRAPKGK